MPFDKELIDAAAAEQLGPTPEQAAAAAAAAPVAPAADTKPTPAEAAAATIPMKTEADRATEEAIVMFDVPFGPDGNVRQLSAKQIEATFGRYGKLNHDHAQNKDVLKLVKNIIDSANNEGAAVSPPHVAEFLTAAAEAYVKNPIMGDQEAPPPANGQDRSTIAIDATDAVAAGANPSDYDTGLTKWEEDNGVSLPPGFREQATQMSSIAAQNKQLIDMISKMSDQQNNTAAATSQAMQTADNSHIDALRQSAANNLNKSQTTYGLSDDMESAFFEFAYERGYSFEDFIDPELTDKVVGDFKAVQGTAEFDRLKSMATKRQAFTGGVDGSPGSGTSKTVTAEESFFNEMVNGVMDKRITNNTLA